MFAPPCSLALQGADRAGDGRVDVGQRRHDHAGGEGAGVEAVLGVQDQDQVHRPDLVGRRLGPLHHVREVPGEALVDDRLDERPAVPQPVDRRDHRGDLRRQPDAGAVRAVGADVLGGRVVAAGDAHRAAQGRHRRHARRQALEEVADLRRERGVAAERVVEGVQLRRGRQLPLEQQVGDLLEAAVLGEIVDAVAAVKKHALLPVDEADRAVGGHHSLEALGDGRGILGRGRLVGVFRVRSVRSHCRSVRFGPPVRRGRRRASAADRPRRG